MMSRNAFALSFALAALVVSCTDAFGKYGNPYDPKVTSLTYNDATISGHTLASSEIWSGNITLTGSVTVGEGCFLVIAEGTTIDITPGQAISIAISGDGVLRAVGNSGAPIVFRSSGAAAGDWSGIAGAIGGRIVMAYCVIQDAVDGIWSNRVNGRSGSVDVDVSNCYFDNCLEGGLMIVSGKAPRATTFEDCPYGIFTVNVIYEIDGCEFKDCDIAIQLFARWNTMAVRGCNFYSSASYDVWQVDGISTGVTIRECYPESPSLYGNGLSIVDGQSSPVSSAGCGFDYSSYTR